MVTDVSSNITAVRWEDDEVVNAISTFHGKQPIQQVKCYCHREKQRVNIEQANIINQYNMSMEGVDRMDQNISADMIILRTKKWWWPLFQCVVDVAVNNAYQIYRQSPLNPGKYRLNAPGFRRAIVDVYYRLYRKILPSTTLFTGSRSSHHPVNNLQFDGINHWIAKGSQQRCSLGCKRTSVYYCKKCNVGLHVECFESLYVEQSVKSKKVIFYFSFSLYS